MRSAPSLAWRARRSTWCLIHLGTKVVCPMKHASRSTCGERLDLRRGTACFHCLPLSIGRCFQGLREWTRRGERSSWLYDQRVRALAYQILLLSVIAALVWGGVENAIANMRTRGIPIGFGFWNDVA